MKKILVISLILIVWSFANYSYADIYKYVDEDGVIHLTNIPKGNHYKKIIAENVIHRQTRYNQLIRSASFKYGIEPSLIKALITVESNWDSSAVSKKGAIGLMQIMPATATDMKIINPYDPGQNIEAGTRYLRFMLDRFKGNLNLALAAYNAGPATVEKSGGVPAIAETRNYIKKVLSIHNKRLSKPTARTYRIVNDNGSILYTDNPSGI
jgi:soluble lytic murein transglycosylase